jgi:hypothetical protein
MPPGRGRPAARRAARLRSFCGSRLLPPCCQSLRVGGARPAGGGCLTESFRLGRPKPDSESGPGPCLAARGHGRHWQVWHPPGRPVYSPVDLRARARPLFPLKKCDDDRRPSTGSRLFYISSSQWTIISVLAPVHCQ